MNHAATAAPAANAPCYRYDAAAGLLPDATRAVREDCEPCFSDLLPSEIDESGAEVAAAFPNTEADRRRGRLTM